MVDSRLKHIAEIIHKAMSRANLILKSFYSLDKTLLTTAFCTTSVRVLFSSVVSSHTVSLIKLKKFSDLSQRELLSYEV